MKLEQYYNSLTTDHLLSMRQNTWFYCRSSLDDVEKSSYGSYYHDHKLLRKVLSTRPHRIRARDRRLPQNR